MTLYLNGVKIAGAPFAAGVFASLDSVVDTTCTDADTWYPIAGAFTNDPIERFVFDTDHIKYTGVETLWFIIAWDATLSADKAGTTAHLGVKKNTTVSTETRMGMYLKNADQVYNLGGIVAVELSTNDEIQLVVQSDGDGDVLTFKHFTTSLSKMY